MISVSYALYTKTEMGRLPLNTSKRETILKKMIFRVKTNKRRIRHKGEKNFGNQFLKSVID